MVPLTTNAIRVLENDYLLPNETPQDAFKRVAKAYGDSDSHSERIESYILRQWFMPASPVLSNAGTTRGLPISCFLNDVGDDLHAIAATWNENIWLAAKGGGIGTYWGRVRSAGERIGLVGRSSGVVPFIQVQNAISLAISQGSLRRGVCAAYLPIWHPEIDEFIDIRRPQGGDPKRKALDLHNAVVVDDAFMEAVQSDSEYHLRSPADGEVIRTVRARDLWIKLLLTRLETGEPYILFIDNVNKQRPEILQRLGLHIKTSNLCSEITLPTGMDHLGKQRTAVCCLSSLNAAKFDEWKDDEDFIPDMMRFLDNVLQDFIDRAGPEFKNAVYAATRERSVGLGVMGFHTYLQQKLIPFESAMAKSVNLKLFKHIKDQVDEANVKLAQERGPCPDARDAGIMCRFSHTIAIAPNATSSIICNSVSPGIEPAPAAFWVQKAKAGNLMVWNSAFESLIRNKGLDKPSFRERVVAAGGSIQAFDEFSLWEKKCSKLHLKLTKDGWSNTLLIELGTLTKPQSVNIFLPPDCDKRTLNQLHMQAWKGGLKSLYYLRSKSTARPDQIADKAEAHVVAPEMGKDEVSSIDDVECLACQG